jgi:HK97 family phage portal protein
VKLFAQRSLSGQFWGTGDPDAFTRTEAAVKVSHDTALSDDAVLSAVSLLAGDIAGMPMKAYVTDGQLTQPIATQPSWLEAPDPQDMAMTAYSHKQQVALSILLAGNAYILCEPNIFNPIRLTVLNPIRVRVVKPSEERLFQVLGRTSPFEDWSPSDYETFSTANILHIPYLLRPGKLMGLSPIDAQTGNIGISLAMRKWVETFFGKGGQVSGFVVLPQDASETAVKEAERQVNTRWSGWRKAGIFGVLSGGANWMRTGLSPQDAALPDLWNRQLEMVARIYGIPPFMVGSQEPAGIAYASVESRKDEYVTHCLMRYTRPIEMAYSRLVPGDNRLTVRGSNTEVRFNYDALLRSDTKTRYELYGIALEHKFRTVDEVRAFENLKPMGNYSQDDLEGPGGLLQTPNNNARAGAPITSEDAANPAPPEAPPAEPPAAVPPPPPPPTPRSIEFNVAPTSVHVSEVAIADEAMAGLNRTVGDTIAAGAVDLAQQVGVATDKVDASTRRLDASAEKIEMTAERVVEVVRHELAVDRKQREKPVTVQRRITRDPRGNIEKVSETRNGVTIHKTLERDDAGRIIRIVEAA